MDDYRATRKVLKKQVHLMPDDKLLREYLSRLDSLNSEKQKLQERIAVLTEQNNRHSTFREKVAYFLSHPAGWVCIVAIIIGVYLHFEKVSEIRILREQKATLTEQRDLVNAQLQESKLKLDSMNSNNQLLRGQIEFANQQMEFLHSQMKSMSSEVKAKDNQAMAVRLQENQFHREGVNYLVRCLRDKDSGSETFTGLKLFWGAVQVGYSTKSGLDNCLAMYAAHSHRQISYREE